MKSLDTIQDKPVDLKSALSSNDSSKKHDDKFVLHKGPPNESKDEDDAHVAKIEEHSKGIKQLVLSKNNQTKEEHLKTQNRIKKASEISKS